MSKRKHRRRVKALKEDLAFARLEADVHKLVADILAHTMTLPAQIAREVTKALEPYQASLLRFLEEAEALARRDLIDAAPNVVSLSDVRSA